MKKRKIAILILYMILSIGPLANAQNSKLKTSATIGLTTPILDNGVGVHIGINPAYSLSSRISLESQVSFAHTRITSSFLTGKVGRVKSLNTLLGGRLYLNSAERYKRFYVNLLAGGNLNGELLNESEQNLGFSLGFSVGGFFELKRFLVGISYDTPQNLVLKAGYIF